MSHSPTKNEIIQVTHSSFITPTKNNHLREEKLVPSLSTSSSPSTNLLIMNSNILQNNTNLNKTPSTPTTPNQFLFQKHQQLSQPSQQQKSQQKKEYHQRSQSVHSISQVAVPASPSDETGSIASSLASPLLRSLSHS